MIELRDVTFTYPGAEDPVLARKVVEIIREAVTNAVRHGGAENIYITIEGTDKVRLIIENDGQALSGEIRWGGGLHSIQRRVEEAAGRLLIESDPRFRIIVELMKIEEMTAWSNHIIERGDSND